MKYMDEFRDPEAARVLLAHINSCVQQIRKNRADPVNIMEFCGGHTHTVFRYGLDQLLPEGLELVHGPGCPVCVLPRDKVDECIAIANCENVILATFGDAIRVPGSNGSLMQAQAAGADIRIVYSPLDALALAGANQGKRVVFFALGFETTMPSTALTLQQAKAESLRNFSVLCNHVTTPPTLLEILKDDSLSLDGFIAPGHVAMVVGEVPFNFVADTYKKPLVISGFEPLDILQSIYRVLLQVQSGVAKVENQYRRVVRGKGNLIAAAALADVFRFEGNVQLSDGYAEFDARKIFGEVGIGMESKAPQYCSEVLHGRIRPTACPHYGRECRPESPLGALMVSSEGACAAYYQYREAEISSR